MSGSQWPFVLSAPHPDGDRVVLRPLRRGDRVEWERLRERNREWTAPWESRSPVPGAPLPFRRLVRFYDRSAIAGLIQPFVIERHERIIGHVALSGIVMGAQRGGTAGYWVDRDHVGCGIAPLALAVLVDHALGALELHRVEVNIRPENTASIRVVNKLGFRHEGVRRSFLYVDGAWRDHHLFALTTEDRGGRSVFEEWYAAAGGTGSEQGSHLTE